MMKYNPSLRYYKDLAELYMLKERRTKLMRSSEKH
jgi:hypothetical protein